MKLRKLLSFVCCLIFIFTFAVSNVYAAASTDESVIDNYLSEAGFPDDIIEILPDQLKQTYYEKRAFFESYETTYGIMTEEYSIEYTLNEAQEIVINEENMKEYERFAKDSEAVKKVKENKNTVINIPESNRKTYTFSEQINSSVSPNSIISDTNWGGALLIVGTVQSDNLIQKQITYMWSWNYAPFWTLTDHMAVAWSKNFTLIEGTVEYMYTPMLVEEEEIVLAGEPITSGGTIKFELDCGFGVEFNLVRLFRVDGDVTDYPANCHMGYVTGEIKKYLTGDDRGQQNSASAKGKYYHQVLMPGGSLQFTPDGPSIDITARGAYCESRETYRDFDFYQ